MSTKVHCYCNLKNPRIGGMIDPENADQVRDSIPLCSAQCAAFYDAQPRAARDVPAGTSWSFRDHRSLAEVEISA